MNLPFTFFEECNIFFSISKLLKFSQLTHKNMEKKNNLFQIQKILALLQKFSKNHNFMQKFIPEKNFKKNNDIKKLE